MVDAANSWHPSQVQSRAMPAKLYWLPMSHPAMAARKMLELKGIDFQPVKVLPGMQRVHLRLAGFRGGTVPAIKLDGRRVQGSLQIARALEKLRPEPPLFPQDPALRTRTDEAEAWAERELQPVPRVVFRWALTRNASLRQWLGEQAGMPLPAINARISGPVAGYYARVAGADEAAARRAVGDLPQLLYRVDALLDEGAMSVAPPNAAALQALSTVRALEGFSDLADYVRTHACAEAAHSLFPDFPGPTPPFLPAEWLTPLRA
jgi:glutathione S-transferase